MKKKTSEEVVRWLLSTARTGREIRGREDERVGGGKSVNDPGGEDLLDFASREHLSSLTQEEDAT